MREQLNVLSLVAFALMFSFYAVFWLPEHYSNPFDKILGALGLRGHEEYVLFVGDVMLARDVERKIVTQNIDPFALIQPILQEATVVVGNFEAAVPMRHVPTENGQFIFSVRADLLPLLKNAGFTHLSLANNHSLDHGQAGLKNTLKAIGETNINTFGRQDSVSTSTSVSEFSLAGKDIALIGLNMVNGPIDLSTVADVLAETSGSSDWQIAYLHWGEEYLNGHTNGQEKFAEFLIDSGVDAVIGSHPHVAEDITTYKDVPIFYSLGNFTFDQYFSEDVQQGLMLKMTISNGRLHFEPLPTTSLGTPIQSRLMSEQEAQVFLSKLMDEDALAK